jgi:hypothetical protein
MKYLVLFLILLTSFGSVAQHPEKRERIKALKVAFITERLQLTETEAQKFWPIYNAFDESNHDYRKDFYERRKTTDVTTLSEQDAKVMLNNIIKSENERHQLKEKFMNDLLKILPAKKIIQLKIAEDEFNRKMFEQFKKRREGGKPDDDRP